METDELLRQLLKGLVVVYQLSLIQWLWSDVFLTFCYLGLEFCRGHWWAVCHPRFSKALWESLSPESYNGVFVTHICWHLWYEQDRALGRGVRRFLAIFAVLVLCGLCQCVFISLLIADVVLFSIQGNVWQSKSVTFSPVLSQRKESWDRTRVLTPLPLLSSSDPESL